MSTALTDYLWIHFVVIMEEGEHFKIILDGLNLKPPQGIKVVKMCNTHFVWIWHGNEILVHEAPSLEIDKQVLQSYSQDHKWDKSEFKLDCDIIDVFNFDGDMVYILDASSGVHSFEPFTSKTKRPMQFTDVEDIFSSPTDSDSNISPSWKKTTLNKKIISCNRVKSACLFTSGVAVVAVVDERLVVLLCSLPEFNLNFIFDLQKYNSQDAVLCSCSLTSLTLSLKKKFKDDLEVFGNEIMILGLMSGLILWFYTDAPSEGPFALCSENHEVQSIHLTKDNSSEDSELYSHLIIVLHSGPIVIFGHQKEILHLPDYVHSSCCLDNYIITTNLVDVYANKIQIDKEATMNCVSLPVKGVSALTEIPGFKNLILAATSHGAVYCFNPTIMLSGDPTQFVIPDQNLLDNIFAQNENLERIYEQIQRENNKLRAVSAAKAGQVFSHLFDVTVQVISDSEFSLTLKVAESSILFARELWLACVEITGEFGNNEISFFKLQNDFNSNSALNLIVNSHLTVGNIVTLELVSFMEHQQSVLVVPLKKIEIDACHIMSSKALMPKVNPKEESLEEVLKNLNNVSLIPSLQEHNLKIKLPSNCALATLLQDSQLSFSTDEWDQISGGKKNNIQVAIRNITVLLNVESRELTISCSDTQLIYQVRRAILQRLHSSTNKHISENLSLDIQALYQQFEVDSLKDEPDFLSMESLRKKLRSTVSSQLPV